MLAFLKGLIIIITFPIWGTLFLASILITLCMSIGSKKDYSYKFIDKCDNVFAWYRDISIKNE